MVYTVDEVSVELGIPRPTVYRYLKEYSIPFARRSGRIFVPEASIRKIRTVRELHDEGLGTEAVRARLRQGDGTDLMRIVERLDELTKTVERSRLEASRPAELAYASPAAHALRMVLARQSLLISAVSNLSEMMGDLMAANGLPRKAILDHPGLEHRGARMTLYDRPRKSLTAPEVRRVPDGETNAALPRRAAALPSDIPHDKFGTLARRRRVVLASALIVVAILAILIWQAL